MPIWVPWRVGKTAREQQQRRAKRAAGRPKRAPGPSKKDTERVIKTKRKQLFRDLKNGKITRKEYNKAIARLR
jgi:hypothetical protein